MSTSVPPPGMPSTTESQLPPSPAARTPRLRLLAVPPLAAVLAGVALIAFGSTTNKIVDPVAQAATLSSSGSGYRMRMAMEITSSAMATPVTATGNGSFDVRDRAGSMSFSINLGADAQATQTLGTSTVHMDEIVDGTTLYMRLPSEVTGGLGMLGKPWIKVDLTKIASVPGLASLQGSPASSNPSQLLQYLRAASDSVVAEGRQRVNGLRTTHYRADLNLDRVADALPSADRAVAQQALSALQRVVQVHTIPVDVWVDGHRLVRRLQMQLASNLPNGQTMQLALTVDISQYGPQPRPTVPDAGEVQDVTGLSGAGG